MNINTDMTNHGKAGYDRGASQCNYVKNTGIRDWGRWDYAIMRGLG